MSGEIKKVAVLTAMDRARDVLAETYAKYQLKIGPFASQSQQSNVELRVARDAVAELIDADNAYNAAKAAFDAACRPATHTHKGTSPKHGDPVVAMYHEAQRRRDAALSRVTGDA